MKENHKAETTQRKDSKKTGTEMLASRTHKRG